MTTAKHHGPDAPIDFASLAAALLDRADQVVADWLPGGAVCGQEYVCGSLSGGKGESCSVNLRSGAWADFASDDRGGDLISLYAAVSGLNNGQAARELMRDRRRMHGNAHLDECWRRGVQQRQPGWFFAREGALAVGTPWDDPGLTNFAAAQITSGQALLMTRVPEAGDAG